MFSLINRISAAASVSSSFIKRFHVGKLNHIAIATRDLKGQVKVFQNLLGAQISERKGQPEHGVYTTFVNLPNTKIELLEEYGSDGSSPIHGFLEKNPRGGIHHLCFEVEDLDDAVKGLAEKGINPIGPIKIGAHGNRVVFLHPRDCNGILTELEEISGDSKGMHI